jgi:hypothetical protein
VPPFLGDVNCIVEGAIISELPLKSKGRINSVARGRTDDWISGEIAHALRIPVRNQTDETTKWACESQLRVQTLFDLVDPGFKLNMITVKSGLITCN